MTGAEDGDRTGADDPDPDRPREVPADDGADEFGRDHQPVDETSSRADESTADRRITVDLDESASEPPERDPDRDPVATGPDPGPNADRNWTVLLVALSLTALATAGVIAVTADGFDPVAGAGLLGVGFLALAGLTWQSESRLVATLSAGWAEHRRYTLFATGLFAVGIGIGALLLFAGVDLLEMIAELFAEEFEDLLPAEGSGEIQITATWFVVNNSQPFFLSIVGALSLGLLTAFVMVFNGIIVGNLGAAVAGDVGVDFIIVGLVPHGVFELAALFIASGVGFRLIYRFGERLLGSRDAFVTKPYLARTVALVAFAWLLLVLAAFVEAYVTSTLLEILYSDPGVGSEGLTRIP
ncbi:DUF7524 family protein [Halopiger goleimassiliensis]|uniref:DUF7524 family protein n=1 Tax=Halopiger goleimassiliensis TaxID=1293048 RepID=UPI000677C3A5|nr:stage II sporulation protein M [Halopiger goleimassiliensis]